MTPSVQSIHRNLYTPPPSLHTFFTKFLATNFELTGVQHSAELQKYTKAQADKLGIRGWCMNAPQGSVIGYIEGTPEAIPIMMKWLELQGSPSSVIERVIFTGQKVKLEYDFTSFEIRPS